MYVCTKHINLCEPLFRLATIIVQSEFEKVSGELCNSGRGYPAKPVFHVAGLFCLKRIYNFNYGQTPARGLRTDTVPQTRIPDAPVKPLVV